MREHSPRRAALGEQGRSPATERDWLIAAIALVGLGISVYLTVTQLSRVTPLFCEAGSGCDIVQASRYARFLGLPTPGWGIALYGLLTLLALGGLAGRRWLAAFVLAVAGASFSGYLTYLAIFELRAVCPYCLADAAVALGLLLVLLARRPEAGRRSRITPARLVAVGLATAVVTVVVAGASFVADSSSAGSSTYQASLARHLAASGAVFYGAYW